MDWAAQSDERLMVHYQQGEYRAFDEIFRRYSGKVYGYFKRRSTLPGEAEDLLQQVFLRVHRYRDRFDSTLPFVPWLFSIAHNVMVSEARKKRAVPLQDDKLSEILDRSDGNSALSGEPAALLQQVLSHLPEEQRALLRMRFEEGLSFDAIAERIGVRPVSVRKRVSRTMQSLKKIVLGTE